ncbi:MAG: carboxypeptidase regulatory-like domain-containing protein [Acidobacteriaceae bacterium]
MYKTKLWLAAIVVALVAVVAGGQHAQAQEKTGTLHGHVQDPAGTALAGAQVQVSTDGKTAKYTFTADQNGDYKGSGIEPGTYVITMFQVPSTGGAPKPVDRFENVKITAGQDTLQDFDLSRPDYIKKLSPEEQKAIQEAKGKNAQISKENQDVKKLNGMLQEARSDLQAKNFDGAATLMQQGTQIKPDSAVLWLELGTAQNGQKKYDDAATSLKKALELDAASKKPSPEIEGAANNALGEAYAATNKIPDATAAYDAAAKVQPAEAGMFYSNETIVLSKAGNADATVAAADKAIAADPKKPIPYYLKGQALISKATVDPKTQKIVAPPGTEEAYTKYLELAPTGPMAGEAKAILSEIGTKQQTKYSAGKK